jgi:cell division septum initiation protein DivIVA
MATNKLVAAETIRILATRYKDMVEVAELLESIGSIEQATSEADRACKIAQLARDESLTELREAKERIRSSELEKDEKMVDAKADIDLMLLNASEQKLKIIEDANAKADSILQKANASASSITEQARSNVDLMETRLKKFSAELRSVIEAKSKAEEEAQIAESKLKSVQAKIRKLAEI